MQDDQKRGGREVKIRQGELERFKAIGGPILRAHVYDQSGCPKCGVPNKIAKTWCYGIEPDLQRVLFGFDDCRMVGPHLHAECQVCKHHWFERCHDDDLMRDGRGAIRYDEVVVDGEIVRNGPHLVEVTSRP